MIVAGFGFSTAATTDSLRDALEQTGVTPDMLATVADKAEAPALRDLAQALNLPMTPVPPARIAIMDTLTQSGRSHGARGTGSVAEAAALAALRSGQLTAPRAISSDRMATCAIAEGEPL